MSYTTRVSTESMIFKIQLTVCRAQSKWKMKLWYTAIPTGHNPNLNENLYIVNTNQEKISR
jgi:hypothetical protein